MAGLAALIVIVLLLAATIATVAWLGSDDDGGDDSGAVGARPESTREAELEATIAGLEARIAADASPSPATTPSEPPPAPTELPPTPTAPAAATEAEGGSGIATATAAPAQAQADGAEISAASLLPSDEDVPAGFVLADDAALASIEEVAGAFSDPDDAATRLENWGWEENASRTYQLAEDAAAPESGMTFLYVSIHRFGSDQAAQEALTYFADELVAFRDLTEAEVSDIGDTARGLVGPIEGGGEEGALYVQEGPYLLRIGSVAPEGAALSAAVDAGRAILERAGL